MIAPCVSHAQIIADPTAAGNQQPTVLAAPNHVPLVNIQTPSAAGVSRNAYRQFDVPQQGAILNNSRTPTQTQLGGSVQGNPWLATGSARVILNEIHSNYPSQLRGHVEVAGQGAQVVVANPSGVTCDGCGFINAHRATITTGTPIMHSGNLESFRVQGGGVTITGQGMDARTTNYTDILTRAAQIHAGIWAKQLNVVTGTNQISVDQNKGDLKVQDITVTPAATANFASSHSSHPEGPRHHSLDRSTIGDANVAPVLAVDTAQLGGMYAGKITLLAPALMANSRPAAVALA